MIRFQVYQDFIYKICDYGVILVVERIFSYTTGLIGVKDSGSLSYILYMILPTDKSKNEN